MLEVTKVFYNKCIVVLVFGVRKMRLIDKFNYIDEFCSEYKGKWIPFAQVTHKFLFKDKITIFTEQEREILYQSEKQ